MDNPGPLGGVAFDWQSFVVSNDWISLGKYLAKAVYNETICEGEPGWSCEIDGENYRVIPLNLRLSWKDVYDFPDRLGKPVRIEDPFDYCCLYVDPMLYLADDRSLGVEWVIRIEEDEGSFVAVDALFNSRFRWLYGAADAARCLSALLPEERFAFVDDEDEDKGWRWRNP